MDFYGIDMKGVFRGEKVPTLPIWTSTDEGREIYCLDTNKRYYGNSIKWVEIPNSDNIISKTDYDANTILSADIDNTPTALPISEGEILGRVVGGNIDGLSAGQVRTIINVEDGADVTDAENISSSINSVFEKITPVEDDYVAIIDSEDDNTLKKVPMSSIGGFGIDYEIFISSVEPNSGDGEDGDIWLQYTE